MNILFLPFHRLIRFMQTDPGFRFFVTMAFLIIMVLGVVIFAFMKK